MSRPRAHTETRCVGDPASRRRQSPRRCDVSQPLWRATSICTRMSCRESTTVRPMRRGAGDAAGRGRGGNRNDRRHAASALGLPRCPRRRARAPRSSSCARPPRTAGIDIRIVSGAEVSLVWALEASDDQLALATYDQRGTDLLIETPTFNVVGLERLLYQLRTKGLRVTLAHPERNVEFQRDPSAARRPHPPGGAAPGERRDPARQGRRSDARSAGHATCASRDSSHALASDGHRAARSGDRSRAWPTAMPAAVALVGPERAHWMTQTAPAAVIAGAELPGGPAAPDRAAAITGSCGDGEERSATRHLWRACRSRRKLGAACQCR